MRVLEVKEHFSRAEGETRLGTYVTLADVDEVLIYSADVMRPDGLLLLKFRKGALKASTCVTAYEELSQTERYFPGANNRGTASGKVLPGNRASSKIIGKSGSISNTTVSPLPVKSGVIGYFDRYPRIPYCRQTAFSLHYVEQWRRCQPFLRVVNTLFAETCPDRYATQAAVVAQTSPDFVIKNTVFSTITVNKNWQTALHVDAGDLPEGFGVMAALTAGKYEGCYLAFPRYRIAVDLRTTDVVFADVHEYHGNTPFVGTPGLYNRISCVFYYRTKMRYCGTAAEELERAKNRKPGDPLWPETLPYGLRGISL